MLVACLGLLADLYDCRSTFAWRSASLAARTPHVRALLFLPFSPLSMRSLQRGFRQPRALTPDQLSIRRAIQIHVQVCLFWLFALSFTSPCSSCRLCVVCRGSLCSKEYKRASPFVCDQASSNEACGSWKACESCVKEGPHLGGELLFVVCVCVCVFVCLFVSFSFALVRGRVWFCLCCVHLCCVFAVFPYTDPAGSVRDTAENDPHQHPLVYCPSPPYPPFQCATCNRNARGPRYRCVSGNHSECRTGDVCVRCIPVHYYNMGIESEHPDAELAWFRRLSLLKPLVDFLLVSTKPITKKWRQRLIAVCLSVSLSISLSMFLLVCLTHSLT